ncbi:MAG: DUF167 domain-containing protein [Rhodanobacteraceae bacterium]|jgi:uncharacterized protein YggU (UPF0235/DUF167 family)|nr:MAG: DUF167 domain-containing protein [Rhodanobacteraceae bacterium]
MPTHTLRVKVKPNARAASLSEQADGTWLAAVRAPPVDGKANAELIALVARHYGCAKSAVSIGSGASGRIKLVKVKLGD